MKKFALKIQGLNVMPTKLTINDINGNNKKITTEKKFEKYFDYMERRRKFEEEWEDW